MRYTGAMVTSAFPQLTPRASWKKLLPREHGSWALAFEPVVLGLLAAFSAAGVWLAVSVAAAFLCRRPWQLHDERPEARSALFFLAALSAVSLLICLNLAGVEIALPLLAALPAGVVFLWYDSQRAARDAVPELAGAAAFACVPAAIALCADMRPDRAWPLTALMLARAIPTVCVVRAYVRSHKGRGERSVRFLALAGSFVAVIVVAALVRTQLCGVAGVVLVSVLALRALWLLGPWPPAFSAKRIGLIECILGAVYVGVLGAVY